MVVVADAFDDETENAKLRAKIYDACRTRGLSPDGKADAPLGLGSGAADTAADDRTAAAPTPAAAPRMKSRLFCIVSPPVRRA